VIGESGQYGLLSFFVLFFKVKVNGWGSRNQTGTKQEPNRNQTGTKQEPNRNQTEANNKRTASEQNQTASEQLQVET